MATSMFIGKTTFVGEFAIGEEFRNLKIRVNNVCFQ